MDNINNLGPTDLTFKIILIGDSSVGKSSIVTKYVSDNLLTIKSMMATMGMDVQQKIIKMNGYDIKLQLWDTAGQERFRSITKTYCRGAMAIIYVFDITNENSFNNIINWLNFVKENDSNNLPCLLVGNKVDLMEDDSIQLEKGSKLAKEYNMPYIESSAYSGYNIDTIFRTITSMILDTLDNSNLSINNNTVKTVPLQYSILDDNNTKSDSCCT